MMGIAAIAVVIAAVLLCIQLVLVGIELAGICWKDLFSTSPTKPRWKLFSDTPNQRWFTTLVRHFAPMTVLLFGVIPIAIISSKTRLEVVAAITEPQVSAANVSQYCNITKVDADIAGQGIRIAIWAQLCLVILIAVFGTFHCKATGAKELGAGLALTHSSLAVALLVQHGLGTLTPADAILGAMILDAQNSALLIQLSTKETLAARWQVGIIVGCQLAGLGVIPFIVESFRRGLFGSASPDCERCLSVFWWVFLSNCPTVEGSYNMLAFWAYYACRCVGSIQSGFLAAINTQHFHLAEKENRALNGITFPHVLGYRDRLSRRSGEAEPLSSLEHYPPGASVSEAPRDEGIVESERAPLRSRGRRNTEPPDGPVGSRLYYGGCPSTITFMYCVYGAFALTSMAVAELSIADNGIQPNSEVVSVGQVTGIVVAFATGFRAVWLLGRMFIGKGGDGSWKFLWPFSFDFLGTLYSPTFIVHPTGVDGEPHFPVYPRAGGQELQLGDVLTFKGGQNILSVSRLRATRLAEVPNLHTSKYTEAILNTLIKVRGVGDFPMDELEVRYLFTDSQDIVTGLLSKSTELAFSLPSELIPQKKRNHGSKFVVTGLMLAHRPRTGRGVWPRGTAAGSSVLFAYQLQEVKEKSGGKFEMHIVYNGAKVAEWSILDDEVDHAGGALLMSGAGL